MKNGKRKFKTLSETECLRLARQLEARAMEIRHKVGLRPAVVAPLVVNPEYHEMAGDLEKLPFEALEKTALALGAAFETHRKVNEAAWVKYALRRFLGSSAADN